jgi:hypothetical protein
MVHKCNISKKKRLIQTFTYSIVLGFLTWYTFFLYDNGILHCDLSLNTTLFHKDEDRMYIGTCDWEFSFRIDSPRTSKYNYGTMEEINKIKPSNFVWIPHYLLSMDKK